MSIDTVVLGASGYVGGELLRLINAHPEFRVVAAVSASRNGRTGHPQRVSSSSRLLKIALKMA